MSAQSQPKPQAVPRLRTLYHKIKDTAAAVAGRLRKSRWKMQLPVKLLPDLGRISTGTAQMSFLLAVYRYTDGAEHNPKRKEKPPKWSAFRMPEDFAKELGFTAEMIRDAQADAVKRGLVARMSQSKDAAGEPEEAHRWRLLPENWPAAKNAFTPRKVSDSTKDVKKSEGEDEAKSRTIAIPRDEPIRVRPGRTYAPPQDVALRGVRVEGDAPPILARIVDGVIEFTHRFVRPDSARPHAPAPTTSDAAAPGGGVDSALATALAEIGFAIDAKLESRIAADLGGCPPDVFAAGVAAKQRERYSVRPGLLPDLAHDARLRYELWIKIDEREKATLAKQRAQRRQAWRDMLADPKTHPDDRAMIAELLAHDEEAQS